MLNVLRKKVCSKETNNFLSRRAAVWVGRGTAAAIAAAAAAVCCSMIIYIYIYTYIYIYIHIYKYTKFQIVRYFRTNVTTNRNMFIYTERCTGSHRNIQNTNI